MAHIERLAPHVADLIAAGEVVERPASVVKELVENAIDAGASAVVVEIQRGGMGMIRVTDNGCGIAPQELPTAFLRHATSKMRHAEDLGRIGTLGFRGEALAAISAVSRTEIRTCQRGGTGARFSIEGGVGGEVEEIGAPEGTTIVVRDLFFNTPARLKFMKKDSAETAAVAGLMQHLSLSHPDISFKFIKDGADSLHTPGDGRLESAIYSALGREFAKSLVPVEGRGGDILVSGFVTAPLMGRGSRSMQTFFVNGRFIKSQLLTAALEEGYRNQMMKGRFPGCVLSVTLPIGAVDVNVHPAKTQVKFAREREVFDAVFHTVLDCLAKRGSPIPAAAESKREPAPQSDFFKTMDAKTYRQQAQSAPRQEAAKPPLKAPQPSAAAPKTRDAWSSEWSGGTAKVADSSERATGYQIFRQQERPALQAAPDSARQERTVYQTKKEPAPPEREPAPRPSAAPPKQPRPFVPAIPPDQQALPLGGTALQQSLVDEAAPWRIAGEVLHTYIVCESEEGDVWLIDKHAAHERVRFDALKAALEPPMRQTLLCPVAAELSREDGALILEHRELLERLGFSCEDFGDGTVLVREVPADMDAEDTAATLEELAADLRTGRDMDERRENLLHTIACKSAIKGGWTSDLSELRVLVEKVQRGEVRFCPHGRPVAVKLTKYELEKLFKRA